MGFFSLAQWVACIVVHCAFRRCLHMVLGLVAGLGVLGPFGPRIGNSSGVLPGNSCGCGGWPGSRGGGGPSGGGLPGGFSGGGSVGCPGVAGGISGGSIGIASPEVSTPGTTTATTPSGSRPTQKWNRQAFCLTRFPDANRAPLRLKTLLGWRVADGFDVVAVGIEHECAVIVRVVVRANTGSAVVAAAGRHGCLIKSVHRGTVLRHDRDMERLVQPAFAADPEIGLSIGAESRGGIVAMLLLRDFHHEGVVERRQCLQIEGLGAFVIRDWKSD